uniref:RNA-directed DNA polymerase n=1 Tax=Meloidogyne enterolobii TaxID=390850 RepID=A0A6V7U675_MELEN|nr:unnamed protein product [Meloidogyne enterolobii]
MWRIPDPTYWNTHFKIGPVNAEVWSPKAIVVDETQYSFIYHKNATLPENLYGLPENCIRMENDVYIEIIKEKEENNTRVKRQSTGGFLKKNRKLFETTPRPRVVETTIQPTTTQTWTSTSRTISSTNIWKVTPPPLTMTREATTRSFPITPPSTRTRPITIRSTTMRPTTTSTRRSTTTSTRRPMITSTRRPISTTTAGTTARFWYTQKITEAPRITSRTTIPTTRVRESTIEMRTTIKPPINQMHLKGNVRIKPTTPKPKSTSKSVEIRPVSEKLVETTERTTTTLVMKREVTEKPWLDPKGESHANSRLNYLEWKNEQKRVLEAREKWISDCHNRNSQLMIARALAREMPEQAARSLYNRDDITAALLNTPTGQIRWQINKCKQVKAEVVEWNRTIGRECYKETPVIVGEKRYFLKTGSRDLMTEGTKINCLKKNKIGAAEDLNNTKIEELKIMHTFQSSPRINRQNPLIFNLGSIFESDQTRLDQNFQDLTKRLNRPELIFPEEKMTEDEFLEENNSTRGTVKAILAHGNKAIQTVIDQGNVIVSKSTEILEKGKTFWEDPFGIKSTIKMIIAVIAGIALLIGVCVIYWKGKIYFMMVINGMRLGIRVANTFLNLIRPRQSRQRITVSAIERRQTPTAPLAEEVLEEEAYILDFIPKVYQVMAKKRRCYININLNGRKTRALFDTGADITYVSKKIADACNMSILKGDFPQAQAANSTPIYLLGSSNTLIEIGNLKIQFPILISENDGCPGGAIIGTDLMEEINRQEDDCSIGLDFKEGKIKLGRVILPMVQAVNLEWKPIAVQLLKTQILPALSDSLVWGKINRCVGPEDQYITEESEHRYFPLRVGKCLVKPMAKRIVPLRLLNYGNSEIKVHANSKLATLEALGNEIKIETVMEKDERCMNESEWKKFKEEVDQIPDEANWMKSLPDEPLLTPQKPIYERISLEGTILSEKGLLELKQILEINKEAFMLNDEKIGNFKGKTVHKIDLVDGARPVQSRPYRYPLHLQTEIEKQIKNLLKQNIIRPSSSAWASPIVLARKTDGSYRFCVDYRRLNSITKKQTYFLPRIQDLLDSAMGKQIFSVFDLSAGFHQIRLAKGHEERSAFICHCGLFEYLRVPFGLSGAPTTFQKAMEEVRQACSRSFLVYLDDCILGSEDERSHLNDLQAFLQTMKEAGLKLKPEKCKVGQAEIRYLGHLISAKGIRIDPKDLEPIMQLKKPNTLTELRSLIGMLSYFRKFTPNFAETMGPIYELTKKENTKEWGEIHENALEAMKKMLTSAPVLAPPKLGKPFIVETDASIVAIAGCLLQLNNKDENLHPIAYFSRKLNKHERRYAVVELEALAIVASLKNFRPYLEGAGKSTVITDNSALTSLFRRKDLEGRLAKYQISIMAYDVDIIYRPGKKNHFCDHLSRFIDHGNLERNQKEINLVKIAKKITAEEMLQAQNEDKYIQEIKEKLGENKENEKWREWRDIIWLKDKGELKILVPESIRKRLMTEYHQDPIQGGHLGEKRTLEKIKRSMFWDKMSEEISSFVKNCDACQRRKIIGLHQSKEPICPIEPAGRPFQRVHVDLMGPLPMAKSGYKYILMIVDSFSKMMIPVPLREQLAGTVMEAIITHLITKFGVPECLVSDQGTQFLSTIFKDVSELFGIKLQTTTPYHQSANGQCERYNRTLADMISTTTRGKDWPQTLPLLAFAYNTSINSQVGETPFFIAHGWNARLPSENALNKPEKEYENMTIYARELKERMREAHNRVKNKLDLNVEKMKRLQKSIKTIDWNEGDLVLVKREEKGTKFDFKFRGPLQIIRVEKPNLVLEDPESGERKIIHMDKCKPYRRDIDPKEPDNVGEIIESEEEERDLNTNSPANLQPEVPVVNRIEFNPLNKIVHNCRSRKIHFNKNLLNIIMSSINEERALSLARDDEIVVEQNTNRQERTLETQENGRRMREEKAWEKSEAWGWPPINDCKRTREMNDRRREIGLQINEKMLEKYAENNSKRVEPFDDAFVVMGKPELRKGDPTYDELVEAALKNPYILKDLRRDVEEDWKKKVTKDWSRKPNIGENYGRGREREKRGWNWERDVRGSGKRITPTREPIKIVVEEKGNSGSTLEEKKKKLMEELEALKAEEEKEEQKRREEEEEKKKVEEEKRVREEQKGKPDFDWAQKLWENESRALKIYEELRKVRKLWEEKLDEEEKEKWQKIKKSEN